MSMEEAENLLRRVGLKHGPISEWVTSRGAPYITYFTQVQVNGLVAWCYVQIWDSDLPDVYLCSVPVHEVVGRTPRNILLRHKFWSWQNVNEKEDSPCAEEQKLFFSLLSSML